jgi:hypothetical protein
MAYQESVHNFIPSSNASVQEKKAYERLQELNRCSPLPDHEVMANLELFLVRASFVRIQFMYTLYLKALKTNGVIMEFGCRWGRNLALFTTFRNIHEPYNIYRKIIGFDTFEGFPSVSAKDGKSDEIKTGAYSVPSDYSIYLDELLSTHEQLGPRSHVKKYEIIKGDVIQTLPQYLEEHTGTMIALAYFDLDLYEPTKKCLELIRPYLIRNSIVGFSNLGNDHLPGETQALKEAWGLSGFKIIRDPMFTQHSYLVIG